ncbi:MAG: HesA/MoeB/ThiF family protein [Candidatus Freyarchaeota archaeon]
MKNTNSVGRTHGRVEDLSDEELEFYSRQIVLTEIGYTGQLKLRNARVCVVGLGGLGSPAALQLAAAGVGYLRLVDHNIVELSNLQRQHLYSVDYLGYPKVEVAARRLHELNPNIEIDPLPLSLTVSNAEEIVRDMDVVIDGLDRMTPRYALNRACLKTGVPYVFGAAIMTFGNMSTIIPGRTPCLECFQGNLSDDRMPTCAVVGVHPPDTAKPETGHRGLRQGGKKSVPHNTQEKPGTGHGGSVLASAEERF